MNVMGIIFANIYDSSLGELTNKRTMASLPFGGRYRQIDFSLSNMANSGIQRIGVLSRYNYQSLMNHIGSGEEWNLDLQEGGLEFLTPYAMSSTDSCRGKLEALYFAMDFLENGIEDEYVVLADSSVLCNMDLTKVLDNHIASGKDLTVVVTPGIANNSKPLDLTVKLDKDGQIADMAVDYVAPSDYMASMGIFVIAKSLLLHYIQESIARSLYRFERDFVLHQYRSGNLSVNIYRYDGKVMFNESTEEYYLNNLSLIHEDVRHSLFTSPYPIYTKVRDRVPCYYGEHSQIDNCIVADGCMLEGTAVNSVLFRQVSLSPGAVVENCLIMNNAVIGENSELRCVILDKDVTVRAGSKLIGTLQNPIIVKKGAVV